MTLFFVEKMHVNPRRVLDVPDDIELETPFGKVILLSRANKKLTTLDVTNSICVIDFEIARLYKGRMG